MVNRIVKVILRGDIGDLQSNLKVAGKANKLCVECAVRARDSADIAEQSEAVVQQIMGFKGRR